VVSTPKNKKARFQVLPRALADELRPWSLRTPGQLLFPAPSGISLPNNVLNRAYARLADKAHVRRITSHGARHTSGSSYAVLGAGQKMIATLLGHADMQSTERYTHVQVLQRGRSWKRGGTAWPHASVRAELRPVARNLTFGSDCL
jgi:integrase